MQSINAPGHPTAYIERDRSRDITVAVALTEDRLMYADVQVVYVESVASIPLTFKLYLYCIRIWLVAALCIESVYPAPSINITTSRHCPAEQAELPPMSSLDTLNYVIDRSSVPCACQLPTPLYRLSASSCIPHPHTSIYHAM